MKVTNRKYWNNQRKINVDPYSKAVVDYAERWANLMEEQINSGKKLEDIAKETSHQTDINGITGFQYGCAVEMLASCWEHGEQLRRWHNLDVQMKDEGEKANESGGVLNPALMSISI